MGIMYAMKCDFCGEIQVKEAAHEIKGKTYTENGGTKFSCAPCSERLKGALALDKKGLDDPLGAVGRLLQERDDKIRNLEMANAVKSGAMFGAAEELKRRKEGSKIPVMGLDFEADYRTSKRLGSGAPERPALPAPKTRKKKK